MRKSHAKKWTLIVLVIFALIAVIGGTYSRYTSSGSGTATAQVAKWAIKLVGKTGDTQNETFTVTFTEEANDNIVNNRVAPTSKMYADFVIDPSGSEVAVDYDFALSNIQSSTGVIPEGFKVTKVCKMNGTEDGTELTKTGEGTAAKYSETIPLSSQTAALDENAKRTIRIYVEWTNDNDAHSANDTTAGLTPATLTMTVTGTARQHIN